VRPGEAAGQRRGDGNKVNEKKIILLTEAGMSGKK
jgi:hypothetical protein